MIKCVSVLRHELYLGSGLYGRYECCSVGWRPPPLDGEETSGALYWGHKTIAHIYTACDWSVDTTEATCCYFLTSASPASSAGSLLPADLWAATPGSSAHVSSTFDWAGTSLNRATSAATHAPHSTWESNGGEFTLDGTYSGQTLGK